MRRKGANQDSDSVTANLMGRENFSLDSPVPKTPTLNNLGFFDLPLHDQRNFLLLVLLYFLQGIPMGLAMGSVPFLLKNHMSYAEIGVFSLASYPYSLKLFWSPFVDPYGAQSSDDARHGSSLFSFYRDSACSGWVLTSSR